MKLSFRFTQEIRYKAKWPVHPWYSLSSLGAKFHIILNLDTWPRVVQIPRVEG